MSVCLCVFWGQRRKKRFTTVTLSSSVPSSRSRCLIPSFVLIVAISNRTSLFQNTCNDQFDACHGPAAAVAVHSERNLTTRLCSHAALLALVVCMCRVQRARMISVLIRIKKWPRIPELNYHESGVSCFTASSLIFHCLQPQNETTDSRVHRQNYCYHK
jgi:hypothetical protein